MNDKMIEEMAKDLKNCLPSSWYWLKSVDSDTYCVAKHFHEQGYRKLPEGSVVLSKKEHQKYCAYKIIEPQIRGCLDRERELEKQISELEEQRDRQVYISENLIQEKHRWTEQARKETAEKFVKKLENGIDNLDIILHEDNDEQYVSINQLLKFIDEIAKQFGVEVEK